MARKQRKHEYAKKRVPLLPSPQYAAFSDALRQVLQVSHAELGKRIKAAKRQKE